MKIIIAGAGEMGYHLAQLLAHEKQDITLIDTNEEALDYARANLDVYTLKGDCASATLLQQASINKCELLLAVTASEKTNLIVGILAKKMGAKQTIARVSNQDFLRPEQKLLFKELGIDVIISPTQLAAKEIQKLIKRSVVTDVFDFDEGRFSLLGITLDDASPMVNFTVGEIDAKHPEMEFRPISILRGDNTIIPRSGTILKRSDHIYFISPKEGIEDLLNLIGKQPVHVKNIMIIGGGELTVQCARLLEKEFRLTIVEKEKERCKNLAEHLNHTLILRGDPSNVELLKEEGLSRMDAFIALTPNTETNIITSLVAEQCGVFKTIALVDNVDYFHISQNIGVDTLINKKLIAANNVFRYVRKGKIEAITSLHGVDAEVIEFVIDKENKLTRSRLKDLRFPTKSVVGGVIRGEENLVPNGEFQFKKDDKVIVFAQNEAIAQVEELFR